MKVAATASCAAPTKDGTWAFTGLASRRQDGGMRPRKQRDAANTTKTEAATKS
jgi:hypothetical protein